MNKYVKINTNATIDVKIVTKIARAAVTFATDNKRLLSISFYPNLQYTENITV